jgi:pimeloyl-ACP methyl ester carboxylesterase
MKGLRVLLVLIFVGCGPAASDGADDVVRVDGRDLAVHCQGAGSPTVVIDAGWGEASSEWAEIAVELSRTVLVCTFDRAGYGGSDPGPMPRTPRANADDLRALLAAAGVRAPFVLVGHSLGGLNAQAYWSQYPEEVAGLVLFDPPPRAWLERRRFPGLWNMAVAVGEELSRGAEAARDQGSPDAERLTAMASEHNAMLRTGADAAAIESFEALPFLVVAAGRPNPAFGDSAAAYQTFWIDEDRRLANRSSRGLLQVLDTLGHSMNREAPDAVVALILDFVERL